MASQIPFLMLFICEDCREQIGSIERRMAELAPGLTKEQDRREQLGQRMQKRQHARTAEKTQLGSCGKAVVITHQHLVAQAGIS